MPYINCKGTFQQDANFSITLLEDQKVRAVAIQRYGLQGLVRSIAPVPDSWELLASTHVSIARILNPTNDYVWKKSYNVNNEIAHVQATKSYDNTKKGENPYVLIINGQTFSKDPMEILKYIQDNAELDGISNIGLRDYGIPLSGADTDTILGDNVVWATKDGKKQQIKVPIFTLDQYVEAQQDIGFLKEYPTFIAILTEEQAQLYRHENPLLLRDKNRAYSPESKLLDHVPSHIQAGTKYFWESLLKVAADVRGYDIFHAKMPDLEVNSGRVTVADNLFYGFDHPHIKNKGCTIWVNSHNALDTLVIQLTESQKLVTVLQDCIRQASIKIPQELKTEFLRREVVRQ